MGGCQSRTGRIGKDKNLPVAGMGPGWNEHLDMGLGGDWFECRPVHYWPAAVGGGGGGEWCDRPGKMSILNKGKDVLRPSSLRLWSEVTAY